jgi:hypothetical protein
LVISAEVVSWVVSSVDEVSIEMGSVEVVCSVDVVVSIELVPSAELVTPTKVLSALEASWSTICPFWH